MGNASPHPAFLRQDAALLREAARTATEPVELRTLVEGFADLTIQATGSFRATVFLLENERLVLWANQSRETDPEKRQANWERGLALDGIHIDEVPERRFIFELGLPIAISDARASDLVPSEWAAAFDLGALVVTPLIAGAEPLGLLVADWPEARQIAEDTVDTIGAIGASLALAVGNAVLTRREAERNDALQALLTATTVLRSSEGFEELAESLTTPLARALGADGVSICLLENGGPRWRTLAALNPAIPKRGSLADLARPLRRYITDQWRDDPRPVVVPAGEMGELTPRRGGGPVVLLPLATTERSLLGFVLVTLPEREPAAPAVELARALSAHLAAAIERAHLQESLALETERLRGLCALWGFETDALDAYSAAIEEAIGPALGFTVVRISVAEKELRSLGYFSEPDELDEQLMARWDRRRSGAREPLPGCAPGELAAPLSVRGRVVGVVRARARQNGLSQREAEMLDALAAAFGRAIEQESERRAARAKELDLALADQRERVASRLHDTVGRLLYALNLRAGTLRLAAGDMPLADEARQIETLARSGLAGLRRSVATLASMRLDDRGLLASLERLVAEFQDSHDVDVRLAADAGDVPLPAAVEDALFQVAGEALENVARHARAKAVTISLDRRDDAVVLRVRDDGIGLGRSDAPSGTGLGLDLGRKALEPFGGHLELFDRRPGVELVASVPTGSTTRPLASQQMEDSP